MIKGPWSLSAATAVSETRIVRPVTTRPDDHPETAVSAVSLRSRLKAVAWPREHGGWGLTLEPVLLGVLVAWSVPGLLIALAAFGAFLVRTPLKLVGVDARRHQWRDRSVLAIRLAAAELLVVVAAAGGAIALAGWRWLIPVAVAAPLVGVELWYDVRSRGRRLVPELCGAIGVSATAAAIVLAERAAPALAVAMWLVLAARSVGAVPFVRAQVARLHRRSSTVGRSDLAQLLSVGGAAIAVAVDDRALAGAIAVGAIATAQVWSSRRPLRPIKVIGYQQMAIGLGLVVVTAIGVHLA
ncbi:MAG: YwiC-like family protein [Desertimonas sp.]